MTELPQQSPSGPRVAPAPDSAPPARPAWQRAASFAARFHRGQTRKDNETPYIAHPFRVALTVRDLFRVEDPVALTAALLHDVIEDTTADYDDVAGEFGDEVAVVVAALTKDMRLPEERREEEYDAALAQAPWQAKLIKLADVYDNFCDVFQPQQRAKAIEKAERAMNIAGDDARLQTAVAAVHRLIADAPVA